MIKDSMSAAMLKVSEANDYITDSYALARNKLTDYFRSYQKWQDWARGTINDSRDEQFIRNYC